MQKKISLNGTWEFKRGKKVSGIKVPSNWFLQGHDFAGEAEYKRKFKIQNLKFRIKSGKYYYIVFKGVDYFAEVYVNGRLAGKHEGYFQAFKFDITNLLTEGDNEIKVKVNSPREDESIWPDKKILIKGIFNHHDARPGSWNKKYGQDKNTGGIWNDVFIEESGAVSIENLKITPVRNGNKWSVFAGITFINRGNPLTAAVRGRIKPVNFKGAARKFSVKTRLKKGINTEIIKIDIKNPKEWWTWDFGLPNLYSLEAWLSAGAVKDAVKETFGLRELAVGKDKNWYLNGKRIFLKGTNMIPTQWLSEYTEDKIKKDISMIKAANINIMRIHAHVNREELYREFDRQGVMVWQDFALQWGYDRSKKFEKNAVRQIKDMVNLLYNRPSVSIWCCHNEPYVNEHELDPVLYRAVKKQDPVRYVYKASDFSQHHYPGWYYDDTPYAFANIIEMTKKARVVSEYGAQALPCLSTMKKMFSKKELFPPDYKKWEYHDFQYDQTFNIAGVKTGKSINEFIKNSQEYQARLVKNLTEALRGYRYSPVNGVFHFMFMDCWPSITWSVVDYFRNPKKGYYALKSAFQPVLPGYKIMTSKIARGYLIGWGNLWTMIYVINDTPRPLKNCVIRVRLKDPSGMVYFSSKRTVKRIPADSMVYPFEKKVMVDSADSDDFRVPKNAKTGKHGIEVEIWTMNGVKISSNAYEFEVIKGRV